MADNIKLFLNNWCSQNHKPSPNYNVTTPIARPNQRLRFKCEVTVEGFSYVGFGSSTNKKDSQTNAARDFTNYLVRENLIKQDSLPQFSQLELAGPSDDVPKNFIPYTGPVRALHNIEEGPDGRTNYITNIFDQKKLEEAEDVDFTADIHGGWSLDNAKSHLHMYMQKNKLQPDYKYSTAGPDHNKSFICELTFFCPQLKRTIYSRESGSNKQSASKACGLSAIRQLYHLKVVEAFQGTATKQKSEQIPAYKVTVNPEIANSVAEVVENLGLVAIEKPAAMSPDEELNMIVNYSIADFEPQLHHRPQIISWAPALPNWNAWTSCNIDEGEEAFLSLEEISRRMKENFIRRRSSDPELQRMLKEREKLPAFHYEAGIIDAIFENQIVMIRGETGSGKTTQVPQFILDYYINADRGAECNIIITQPRRISAVALAERVSQERGESLGQSCGYSVRFDTVLPQPYGGIYYCTVGVLLRKVEGGLRGISHIIVDEIHERDCNTDFLMILLRDMAAAYPNLKILLMSATIDVKLFQDYFPNIFVVEVQGRSFPVNHYFLEDVIEMVDFRPDDAIKKDKKGKNNSDRDGEEMFSNSKGDDVDINCNMICDDSYKHSTKVAMAKMSEKEICFELIEALLRYIENIHPDGAVLIFLPGWNIIQMLLKQLCRHPIYGTPRFTILALHSQVPREEQRRAFQPCRPGVRKIILATNIAETSITINDVMFVIDSCRAKIKMFTSRNNLTSYNTVWASKTNLEQRRGRAGRVREGYAFHLCSHARYERLDIHQTPEMLRTALHEVVLMVKLLRLGNTREFLAKAPEQPPIDAVIEAEHLLREMKALDKNEELTPLGRILARLPIEPRMGKMVVYGCVFGVADACATIAACTSLGDPFLLPPDRKRLSRQQVALAGGRCSDHVAILNAVQQWESVQRRGRESEEEFCEARGLNLSILRMTREAASQIKGILAGAGFPEECLGAQHFDCRGGRCPPLDNVINLLVLGLYPNVCYHKEKRKVLTTEGKAALIHKSSVNCNNYVQTYPSPFFIFGEKMRTRVIACKQMSMINPVQLLMFGARKVAHRGGMIVVDDWLNLDLDFSVAANVVALRPALEGLLVKACLSPEMVLAPDQDDLRLMDVVTALSEPGVGSQGDYQGGAADGFGDSGGRKRRSDWDMGPPPQRPTSYSLGNQGNWTRFPPGGARGGRGGTYRGHSGGGLRNMYPADNQGIDLESNQGDSCAGDLDDLLGAGGNQDDDNRSNYSFGKRGKYSIGGNQGNGARFPPPGGSQSNYGGQPRMPSLTPRGSSYNGNYGYRQPGRVSRPPRGAFATTNYGFSSRESSGPEMNQPGYGVGHDDGNDGNYSEAGDYHGNLEGEEWQGQRCDRRVDEWLSSTRPGAEVGQFPRPRFPMERPPAPRNFRGRQLPAGRWIL